MEKYRTVSYRNLIREETAKFPKRHLVESVDEANLNSNLNYRKHLPRQTFFIVNLSTQFYILPDGLMISQQPLSMVDIMDGTRRIPPNWQFGTYCIWQDDHFDRHLWNCFNNHHRGDPLPERIKKFKQCRCWSR